MRASKEAETATRTAVSTPFLLCLVTLAPVLLPDVHPSTALSLGRSYETADLWPLLATPADGVTVSFVKAERSTFRWGGSDEARIQALGHAVHELPNAGHWVHTDNPGGLFHILAPSFNSEPDLHAQLSPRNNVVASHSPTAGASSAGLRQLTALEM